MANTCFQTEEQLFGLYRFLVLLRRDKIYWHKIEPSGDKIKVVVEPLKGEIDLRLFFVKENGEVISYEFQD